MKHGIIAIATAFAIMVCGYHSSNANAQTIGASGNTNAPSITTDHDTQGGQFQINRDVALSDLAGPWEKLLKNNTASPFFSGQTVMITETLTNTGTVPWTDWHEHVVSRTTLNQPDDSPGFLFDRTFLQLEADYGSGLVNLNLGIDFITFNDPYSGPSFGGNNNHWEAINIFFAPGKEIQPGDTLVIRKRIFEVFGDANVWEQQEIAVIAEYPTPEPVSAALFGVAALGLLARRRSGH